MIQPPKLAVLIPEFPGQTHSFFWREIEALARDHGVESQIISTQLPSKPVYHDWVEQTDAAYLYPLGIWTLITLVPSLLIAALRLLADAESRPLLRRPKTWGFVILALHLGRICQRRGLTHMHVHSCANFALIAALCHKLTGIPYSLVLHGPLGDYGPDQPYKWAGATFVFVITEKLRAEVLEVMPQTADKITVVPMGVDTDVFTPPKHPRATAPDPFVWFCCARLNRVKGFDTLLEATSRLRSARPDQAIRVVIAGEDEQGGTGYHKVLDTEIAKAGLRGCVQLLGSVTQETVRDHLRQSDGFVLASQHEPLGVAYMEAMACELPVVGTRAGGVTELIQDGTDGLLVLPRDAEALAAAMQRIIDDAALRTRLGQKGRARIIRDFSSGRSARALAEALSAPGS